MKNRSRIALLVVVVFLLGAVSITAYQSMSNVVAVVDGGRVTQYETNASTVDELLKQLEINLGDGDTVTPELDTVIENNMKITIDRWMPSVRFTLNGETVEFETDFKTVGEIITAKGLDDEEDISIEPAVTTAITDNMDIEVKTKTVEHITEEREIGFETVKKETTELDAGETKVAQEGQNGLKTVEIDRVYFGGELSEEVVTNVTVTKEPVDKIILVGTKKAANTVTDSKTGVSYEYTNVYSMQATAYTSTDAGCSTRTASGLSTFEGVVAVDTSVIPLGTKLYIEGYGIAVAADTGGAINGHKIDVYFNTASECIQFGRRQQNVYILKDQSIDVRSARQ